MSRNLRNRKRPDSVRMPAVPGLSKHPIIMARSISAGPHPASSSLASNKFNKSHTISSSTPTTPTINKKLEKIPSISAHSESSEEDEEEEEDNDNERSGVIGKGGGIVIKQINNHIPEEDDEDDDDDHLLKKTSVVNKHEYTNTTDWSPGGGGVGSFVVGNGSLHTKNISTKMANGIRACKATGRSLIKMLSTSSSTTSSASTTRRNSKTSCSVKSDDESKVNKEANYLKLNKVNKTKKKKFTMTTCDQLLPHTCFKSFREGFI